MRIDNEFKNLIPPLQPDEYRQLEENILSEGIRENIITWQGIIIDGHNRFEIAEKHNLIFNTIEKEFADREAVKIWIIKNQFGRRNLSAYDRSRLALQLEPLISEKAKLNQLSGLKQYDSVSQKSVERIDTQKELASLAGVSHDTIAKVKVIEQSATPEAKEKLSSGDISINQAYKDIKQAEKKEKNNVVIQELRKKEVLPPTGKYDVIVIDPPWQMKKIERDVAPDQVGFDYPTMTIEEIKNFELPSEDNCHVFMWITQKHHRHGFDIFDSWGVKFICEFVWHKNGGFQPFGLPQFNHEYVMYGRIGTPQFADFKNFFTCFNAKRTGHSAKPEEFYDTLRRVTAGKRIDIFNRRDIEGFDKWGNEA